MACVVSKERGFPAEINWLNYVNMVSFYKAIEPRFQSVNTRMIITVLTHVTT